MEIDQRKAGFINKFGDGFLGFSTRKFSIKK